MNEYAISSRFSLRALLATLLGAVGVNVLLFLLMPYLLHHADPKASLEQPAQSVNVIRVKRPEIEPAHQKNPPPEPKQEKKPQPKPRPAITATRKLSLPFEVNPRLPSSPTTLDLPDIQTSSFGSPDLGKPFSTDQLDNPLQVLVRIPPIYPMNAKRRGVEGWVKVGFVVDTKGQVQDIKILAADPTDMFDQSVQRCVSGWKFSPGTIEGMPVNARVETVIRFKLE